MLFKDVLPLLETRWVRIVKKDLSDGNLHFIPLVNDTCRGLRVDVQMQPDRFEPMLNMVVNSIESDPCKADLIIISLKENR